MELRRLTYDFTICKVESEKELDLTKEFYFVGKTEEEISLVCMTKDTPDHTLEREDGWKAFRIQGVLDFSLIGILAKISTILAEAGIGIFVVSTYNTDYILVKKENFDRALRLLAQHGYQVDDLNIRKAEVNESEKVIAFYHSLIDAMQGAEYGPGWEKEIYPTSEFIRTSILHGELFVAEREAEFAGVMVINHECNESYEKYEWKHTAEPEKISVIHALGVHPKFSGQGIGKKMVAKAIDICRENQQSLIRLDVLKGNLPAEKLYAAMEFEYLATLPMFYEDTGWTDYELYELVLS